MPQVKYYAELNETHYEEMLKVFPTHQFLVPPRTISPKTLISKLQTLIWRAESET